jgi:hypothetical protein
VLSAFRDQLVARFLRRFDASVHDPIESRQSKFKMTPLDKTLKRALQINGRDYVITVDPHVLKITEKGRRLGLELKWAEIVSGETALAVALHASLGKFQDLPRAVAGKTKQPFNPSARSKPPIRNRRATTKRSSRR